MGLTKSILFDNDPAHDEIRKELAEQRDKLFAEFAVRLPTRRKNRLEGGGRWDNLWPSSLSQAAKELGIESININDGKFFRTAAERDRTRARADEMWEETVKKLKLR